MSENTSFLFRRRPRELVHPSVERTEEQSVSVTYLENSVPASIEFDLVALYHNIFSSLEHFKAYGGLTTDTSTYIAREGTKIVAIFLFRRAGNMVLVLNEGMTVSDRAAGNFADFVFSSWPEVDVIVFQAVRAGIESLAFPYQCWECTFQVTMPLPPSSEGYLATLGRNMRRNIRRYLKRLQQDFPSFRFDTYLAGEVPRSHLETIIELSRNRIESTSRTFALDNEVEKIIDLARSTGLVGVATIDGRICAGMIGFRTGDTYFAKVLGHEPAYKDYSLGILCCYLMICECITRGCREFNFMWNEYPYKAALGGRRKGLDRIVIYRSPAQMLRHGRLALKVAIDGWRYRLAALLGKEGQEAELTVTQKILLQLLRGLRRLRPRRSGRSGPAGKDPDDTGLGV